MKFITDKQTLEDLNLLGKYKQNSIFNLFNKVKTSGAEKMLEGMFHNVLTNPDDINCRCTGFKYFQKKKLKFPFNKSQFNHTEAYLSGKSGDGLVAIWFNLAKQKIQSLLLNDESYKNLETGVYQTAAVLQTVAKFLNKFETNDALNPFLKEVTAAKKTLSDQRISWMKAVNPEKKLTLIKIARYDYLLRNVMSAELHQLLTTVYLFDLYIAVSDVAEAKGFSYAIASSKKDNTLFASALWHPRIDKGIANPIKMNSGSNMIFLTGANMAGKSTLMKALAINTYLAQMGFPVAAKDMKFSVKDGIYTSINVSDDLNSGYSHFYTEVLRVKKVAQDVSEKKDLLVIFDELFKGTNVKDAYDATLRVTAAFSK